MEGESFMKITGRQTEPIKCYKKDQLTEDFFAGQICSRKGMETEKYWSDAFKSRLRDILDEVHSSDYGDIRDDIDSDWNMDYETYQNHYSFICGIIDMDMKDTYESYSRKMERIGEISSAYANAIHNFPDDIVYTVSFSRSSCSVYLNTGIPVRKDSVDRFLSVLEPLQGIIVSETYSGYERKDYEDSSLTIRISDHDFEGNRDYSYQFPCVNVIVEI